MGQCAQNKGRRTLAGVCFCRAIALLLVLEAQSSSAGLSELNILPHEQLHKGRGMHQGSPDLTGATEQLGFLVVRELI